MYKDEYHSKGRKVAVLTGLQVRRFKSEMTDENVKGSNNE